MPEDPPEARAEDAAQQVYMAAWKALARPAPEHSPDGTRRPRWLRRPLYPADGAWKLPDAGPAAPRPPAATQKGPQPESG